MAALAFVSLLLSRGLRGSGWAMGVTMAQCAVAFAFVAHAIVFGMAYLVSRAWNRRAAAGAAAGAGRAAAAKAVPRGNTDFLKPPLELP